MGLDATVRCRCFEEGKLKPRPVPYDDLYIDGEGYLASPRLDARRAELGRRRFAARYGELERAFYDWVDHCCEHENGDYVVEWVSNWAGVAGFESRVEEAGGEAEFPLLSHMLPDGNGGIYPAELAEATLKELDRFLEIITNVDEWVLVDAETEEKIWASTPGSTFAWMRDPYDEVGMVGGKGVFRARRHPTRRNDAFQAASRWQARSQWLSTGVYHVPRHGKRDADIRRYWRWGGEASGA